MHYGRFQQARAGTVLPAGFLKEWLRCQNDGLSSHFAEQGFPFDTPMWDGGVGIIKPASIVYNDEAAETPTQEAWWPYEQSAYLLDGLLGVGILAGDSSKIALYRRNLEYLLSHPDEHGLLGHCYGAIGSEWPMAVFFRSAARFFDFTGETHVRDSLIRHYLNLPEEQLAVGFRHINNLEGVLTAYGWSQNAELLRKAVAAYRRHDEYYSLHTEDEFELYRSKITSKRNYVIHGVSFSESIKLPVLLYLYTGDKGYLDDAERGLAEVLKRHEQIPGLPSCNEDFAGRDPLQGYETCVISDFGWSLGYFLMATGDGEYADRMEKIFYNAYPGALLKDFSALQYLSSPNQVIADAGSNHSFFYRGCATFRQFRSDHSAQCCTGNVHRILPNFLMRMWMLTRDGSPAAVLYGPSEYSGIFDGNPYRIFEETEYPCAETVTFRMTMEQPMEMPFTFRIPKWCGNPSLKLNGQPLSLPTGDKGFVTLSRQWRDGDCLELLLPMAPVQKYDRYWSHFEYGPLVFSLPIKHQFTRENPSPFAPCALLPVSFWDYAVSADAPATVCRNAGGALFSDVPPLKMTIKGVRISNFGDLELGRYTPEVPLFHQVRSEETDLELVPYGNALLRITAFPDTVRRRNIGCHQVLVSPVYPYDFTKGMEKQRFLPEKVSPAGLLSASKVIEPEKSGYCDLLKCYPLAEHALAYLYFRFYSDCERNAFFAIGASQGGEFFFENRRIGVVEPITDAEYVAPEIVPVRLKAGYNILVAKCVLGQVPMQYRRVWGAMARAFYVEE